MKKSDKLRIGNNSFKNKEKFKFKIILNKSNFILSNRN